MSYKHSYRVVTSGLGLRGTETVEYLTEAGWKPVREFESNGDYYEGNAFLIELDGYLNGLRDFATLTGTDIEIEPRDGYANDNSGIDSKCLL